VGSFNDHALGEIWYSSRYFYVLLLGAALAPVILKKDLAELEWLSIVLFVSIGLFIVVNFWELVIDPKFVPVNTSTKEYFEPKMTIKFISSLSIILVAYSYQQNVFPVFSSLQVKTN
jgi:amino acid permease